MNAGQNPEQTGQSQTVAIPKRLPLVSRPSNRDETTAKDARLINCFAEKDEDDKEYRIYQRIGTLQSSQPSGGAAAGMGCYNWKGDIYSIFGGQLYKNGVAKGAVDATNGVYRFKECLGGTPKMQLGNGVKAYNYDDGAGLVLINDPDFPAVFVKGWSYLDGTTYVMRPDAGIQGDNLNDPTAWDPLNVIIAQIEPDPGVALAKQMAHVVAFKGWTTEIFFDAGNPAGSPLGTVPGARVNWGCLTAESVRDIDNMLIWLAVTRESSPQVVQMEKLSAQPVSTKPIERLLKGADWTTTYSFVFKNDGHSFYVLTSKVSNITLVYDLTEHMWHQWTDTNGNYFPFVSAVYSPTLGLLLQHETDGRLYLGKSDYVNDNGATITVDIITPNFDGGTRRKKNNKMLELICDQQEGSEFLVRTNDKDYDPRYWSSYRALDASQERPQLINNGTFSRRIHQFRHQKNLVRMPRVQGVEMQIDVGAL